MTSIQEQYDSAFLGILQNEGNIVKFLDVCFSFLFRRTDFYRRMKTPNDKMGFPPGVAEKLVLQAFRKYEKLMQDMLATNSENDVQGKIEHQLTQKDCPELSKQENTEKSPEEKTESETPKSPVPLSDTANNKVDEDHQSATSQSDTVEQQEEPLRNTDVASANITSTNVSIPEGASEEEKQPFYQANPDSYNGAIREGYSWSQSITDVDLKVDVPPSVHKGKDVVVDIRRKHITVRCRQQSGDMCTLVDSDLTWEVHRDECLWSLEPGKCVTINLEKVQERWWEAVFAEEPKINVQKIDPSRPITDLDDEAQAKIEEMMYNERQKKLGLPQSHEQKVHEMLRKGWDAEGSPFKGQPFDPSKLNITKDTTNFNP